MTSQIDLLAALQNIDQRLQTKGHTLQELRQQTTQMGRSMLEWMKSLRKVTVATTQSRRTNYSRTQIIG